MTHIDIIPLRAIMGARNSNERIHVLIAHCAAGFPQREALTFQDRPIALFEEISSSPET
jgi:hypothetical protein